MAKKKRKLTAWQHHVKSYMASHKGLSFKEALPKAKLTYRKGSSPKSKSSNPRPSKKAGKVKRKVAKKKRRRGARTIPLAPVLGVVGGFIIPNKFGYSVVGRAMEGNWEAALHVALMNYTGFNPDDGSWNPMDARGLWTALGGFAVHKIASMLGVNRVLGRAKVPLIRI